MSKNFNKEEFDRVEELFEELVMIPPNEVETKLFELCPNDKEIRERVRRLLRQDASKHAIIDSPPEDLAAEVIHSFDTLDPFEMDLEDYTIVSKLGEGGMGSVYLAEDKKLGRRLALKFFNPQSLERSKALKRFEREAKTTSALNHPNIVTVYDVAVKQDYSFIATEHIEGATLSDRLRERAFDVKDATAVAIQVAKALAASHRAGVVHRDVKPGNIMIRPDGVVKVLDFGIAKLVPGENRLGSEEITLEQTRKGQVLGTTLYMSPEQARGGEIGPQSDIFSFGAVVYAMLHGNSPFERNTGVDIVAAILKEDPGLSPEIPAPLRAIVERCLRKDQAQRYQNMEEVLSDLTDFRNLLIAEEGIREPLVATASGGSVRYAAPTEATSVKPTNEHTREIPWFERLLDLRVLLGAVVAALVVTATAIYVSPLYKPTGSNTRSLAVLPIENDSGDPEREIIVDGITESLIRSLSNHSGLSVVSRASSFKFKGSDQKPIEIGRVLKVDKVMVVRLVKAEVSPEIALSLIETDSGMDLWSQNFKADSENLAGVRREISVAVAVALDLGNPVAKEDGAKALTANSTAFRHYLSGRYQWNKRTPEGFKSAIRQFKLAVENDPAFALAYVGLADSYMLLENYSGVGKFDSLERAEAYAKKALAIDRELAEAHATYAMILHRSWRWKEARRSFETAVKLKPNYAPLQHWYSLHLRETGELWDALEAAKTASELDPLSGIIVANLAIAHLALDQDDEAVAILERSISAEPEYPWTHCVLSFAETKRGNLPKALEHSKKGRELAPGSANSISIHGYVLAKSGRPEEAREIARSLERSFLAKKASGRNIARIYAGLGENDDVFRWLEEDFKHKSPFLPYIRWTTPFDSVRSDDRYNALLRRMGF